MKRVWSVKEVDQLLDEIAELQNKMVVDNRLLDNYKQTLKNLGCTFRTKGEHVGTVLTTPYITPYITPPDVEAALSADQIIDTTIKTLEWVLSRGWFINGTPGPMQLDPGEIRDYIEELKSKKTL